MQKTDKNERNDIISSVSFNTARQCPTEAKKIEYTKMS